MPYPETLFDLGAVRAFPLAERDSLTTVEETMVPPSRAPKPLEPEMAERVDEGVARIRHARDRGASVMLVYGAHLIKNGAGPLVIELMRAGWVTHLATNGAGVIHDWEFAAHGRSTESVRANVATGTFGTWEETGRTINLAALLAGSRGEGLGRALGRVIDSEGFDIPDPAVLTGDANTLDGPAGGRWDLREAMERFQMAPGREPLPHPWKQTSVTGQAFRLETPLSVHPGIGYDIYTNHPMFHGGAIGRAAALDFRLFSQAVEGLDEGVVLSVGSAIMGPQVFEKSLSVVNNVRLSQGRSIVSGHSIYVVDLQDGGGWDWSQGEPPIDNPAYYLRFCKSYARMGGRMQYLQCDNLAFIQGLYARLLG